jgi:16S rRNA (uracil1498-N3)-methyltransferase
MAAHTFSFYGPDLAPSDATVTLGGEEHHHLARVLRMTRGQSILVVNGRGLIVSAEIEAIDANSTTARVSRVESHRPEPVPLVLSLGLLPRGPMETALTQCVEAGITGWVPVIAERCHVRGSGERNEARWTRVAIAAMKQSGRGWLPVIEAPVKPAGLVARFAAFQRVILADAGAADLVDGNAAPAPTLALVGPEAGFTDAELARFVESGACPAGLSAQRLRAETAAVVLVSMLARGRSAV